MSKSDTPPTQVLLFLKDVNKSTSPTQYKIGRYLFLPQSEFKDERGRGLYLYLGRSLSVEEFNASFDKIYDEFKGWRAVQNLAVRIIEPAPKQGNILAAREVLLERAAMRKAKADVPEQNTGSPSEGDLGGDPGCGDEL